MWSHIDEKHSKHQIRGDCWLSSSGIIFMKYTYWFVRQASPECAADVDMRQDEGETVKAVWLNVEGQTPAQEHRAKHLQFTSDKHSGPSAAQLPKEDRQKKPSTRPKLLSLVRYPIQIFK